MAQESSSYEETYRRWLKAVWSEGMIEVADELMTGDFIDHYPIPQYSPDLSGHKKMAADFHVAFPDITVTIHDVIVQDDRLVCRYTMKGTHKGTFLGTPGTGKAFKFDEIDIVRFKGGKIAEWWHQEDIHEEAARELGAPLP
jgi:steroid delta-isomerase-like uncharacterized protein